MYINKQVIIQFLIINKVSSRRYLNNTQNKMLVYL